VTKIASAATPGTSPAINGPEGRHSVGIILGIYQAAETGWPVTLPLKADRALKAHKLGLAGLPDR
jgi:UDP-N-acetyl-2-amino-2-deoxyglucuronate dehydrogenase